RLPGIGCHKLTSAVEMEAAAAKIATSSAIPGNSTANPANGKATISSTGSPTAVTLATSTSARLTGAEAISSGASSPDTAIQARDADTCAAITTNVGASAAATGMFSVPLISMTASGTV